MRKMLLALALALAGLFSSRVLSAAEVVILDLHTFLSTGTSSLDWSYDETGAMIDKIQKMGYRIVSLDDAIQCRIEGKANVVITIDDGNHSVYPAYKAVFAPRGIKPWLFIYAGFIGKHFSLKLDQLTELSAAGCGIGAHGYYHQFMTPKAWARDPATVMIEVTRSGPGLQKLTGVMPNIFAYPYGVGAPEAAAALQKAGYDWAFCADEKFVPVDFADPALDHWHVPRTIVYHWNRDKLMKFLEIRIAQMPPSAQATDAPPASMPSQRAAP